MFCPSLSPRTKRNIFSDTFNTTVVLWSRITTINLMTHWHHYWFHLTVWASMWVLTIYTDIDTYLVLVILLIFPWWSYKFSDFDLLSGYWICFSDSFLLLITGLEPWTSKKKLHHLPLSQASVHDFILSWQCFNRG